METLMISKTMIKFWSKFQIQLSFQFYGRAEEVLGIVQSLL